MCGAFSGLWVLDLSAFRERKVPQTYTHTHILGGNFANSLTALRVDTVMAVVLVLAMGLVLVVVVLLLVPVAIIVDVITIGGPSVAASFAMETVAASPSCPRCCNDILRKVWSTIHKQAIHGGGSKESSFHVSIYVLDDFHFEMISFYFHRLVRHTCSSASRRTAAQATK